MKKIFYVIFLLFLVISFAYAGEVLLCDFEDTSNIEARGFDGGVLEEFSLSTAQKHSGKHSIKIKASYTRAWSNVRLLFKQPLKINGEPEKFGLWIYGDSSSDQKMHFGLKDKTGENFGLTFCYATNWSGWKYIECSLTAPDIMMTSRGGGNNDKKLDLPVSFTYIWIYSRKAHQGIVYLDDLIVKVKGKTTVQKKEIKNVFVPKITAPIIDGKLNDSSWQKATKVNSFFLIKKAGSPTQKTIAYLGYDKNNLYVAFRCFDDQIQNLKTEVTRDDGRVDRDSCVEIFLDTNNDRKTYFHFMTNPLGTRYDAHKYERSPPYGEITWNSNWQVKTSKDNQSWIAEIAIPFRSLGLKSPTEGINWGFNLCREEHRVKEYSSWATAKGFHVPEEFGDMVFGKEIVLAKVDDWGNGFFGKNNLKISLTNESIKELCIETRLLFQREKEEAKITSYFYTLTEKEKKQFILPYQIKDCGFYTLSVDIVDNLSKKVYYRSAKYFFTIPDLQTMDRSLKVEIKRLEKVLSSLKVYETLRNKLVEAFFLENLSKVKEEEKIFSTMIEKSKSKHQMEWHKLEEELKNFKIEVGKLAVKVDSYLFLLKEKTVEPEYGKGIESSIKKILKDALFSGKIGNEMEISLAKNEYEGGQVVLFPYIKDLEKIDYEVTDLINPDSGRKINKENISLNPVGYVKTYKPFYEVDYVGWWPDPLLNKNFVFDVKKGEIGSLWITVYVPKDTNAGIYEGKIFIKPANAGIQIVKLKVKVWDFLLPTTGHFRTAICFDEGNVTKFYNLNGEKIIDSKMQKEWYNFLLAHRLNPYSEIFTPFWNMVIPKKEELQFYFDRGINAFCLGSVGNYTKSNPEACRWSRMSDEEQELSLKNLQRKMENFKKMGLFNMGYIFGFDEIQWRPNYKKHLQEMKEVLGKLKETVSGVKLVCNLHEVKPEVSDYVDVWAVMHPWYEADKNNFEQQRAEGKKLWYYLAYHPTHPYANVFIDYPAVDQRIMFWINWKYHLSGWLFWGGNSWWTNFKDVLDTDNDGDTTEYFSTRWPEREWDVRSYAGRSISQNGNSYLFYPGPDKKPLSSIRLENIRDGIEDYEYFYLLSKKLEGRKGNKDKWSEAKKLLDIPETIVNSASNYTKNPTLIYSYRERIAQALMDIGEK